MTIENYSSVYILTDKNVAPFWLPEVCHWLNCPDAIEIVIKEGEEQKNLQTVQRIWKTLMKHHADRHSLLINLGGGVICDLGGFAASTFMRGIDFINVPTTLLAMVDASIGGKTGIDFGGCKNQIGTFAQPKEICCFPTTLMTLPQREILSGLAEMMKYGFIADAELLKVDLDNFEDYISRCADIKKRIVADDPQEHGQRKVLNFGHTLGHAFESFSLTTDSPLRHGEAVALGMWCALWLSVQQCGLDETILHDYERKLPMLLREAEIAMNEQDIDAIMTYLIHDKKNFGDQIRFVLLEAVNKPLIDQQVPENLIRESVMELLKVVE
ncbi:MAG: 3-dehydroquinate synthase [Bacteroidales bacterium]|nr:3-dehydroquinate synthase [Bacteroidales bacterium]